MIKNITIGSDPEFFLVKNNTIVPSTEVEIGTKEYPMPMGDNYHILRDNVLVEGNIPLTKNKEEFIKVIDTLKDRILDIIGENYNLVSADSAEFSMLDLMSPEACEFGCSPYKNAYIKEEFIADDLSDIPFRVAGFHIHIGYELEIDVPYTKMNEIIAKAFDYFVVYPSRKLHNDPIREKYYGAYGNYRDKPYGIEVRSLGGFFTDNKYLGWVWEQTMKAIEFCKVPANLNKLEEIKEMSEENYKELNINLKEQLYVENSTTISTSNILY